MASSFASCLLLPFASLLARSSASVGVLELVSNHPDELQRLLAAGLCCTVACLPADLSLHLPEPNMHLID